MSTEAALQPPIHIFVSYSHRDAQYLQDNSLMGYLKGLKNEGAIFWDDRQILGGQKWDEVIKTKIQQAEMALVLVSQNFLDSDYCQNQEIQGFLAQQAHIFPVILSPCEWKRHAWLSSRQFLPSGNETIEEHYQELGKQKRLFLTIREQIRQLMTQIRQAASMPGRQSEESHGKHATTAPQSLNFAGTTKIAFCDRLGNDWKKLADVLGIDAADQARFEHGDQARGIWVWLENRRRLPDLMPALADINREDLVQLLKTP